MKPLPFNVCKNLCIHTYVHDCAKLSLFIHVYTYNNTSMNTADCHCNHYCNSMNYNGTLEFRNNSYCLAVTLIIIRLLNAAVLLRFFRIYVLSLIIS